MNKDSYFSVADTFQVLRKVPEAFVMLLYVQIAVISVELGARMATFMVGTIFLLSLFVADFNSAPASR